MRLFLAVWGALVATLLAGRLGVAQGIVAPQGSSSEAPQLVIEPKGLAGEAVASVDISSDGMLVAAAAGKDVRVWSLEDQQLFATLRGYAAPRGYKVGNINEVRFIPGTHHLVVAISDNTKEGSTRVYDLAQPDRIMQLIEGHRGCTIGLAISPSGRFMATWGCDDQLLINRRTLDAKSWTQQRRYLYRDLRDSLEYRTKIDADHSSAIFERLSYFGFPEGDDWLLDKGTDARLINVTSGRGVNDFSQWPRALHSAVHRIQRLSVPLNFANAGTVGDLIPTDHLWVAIAGSYDETGVTPRKRSYWASTWAGDAIEPKAVYRRHRFYLSALALRQVEGTTGRQSLVASGDRLGEVHVWNAETGEQLARFSPRNTQLFGIAWGEDDSTLRVSATPYGAGAYDYNHFGPLTHSFDLKSRRYEVLSRSSSLQLGIVNTTRVASPSGDLELSIRGRTSDSGQLDICGVDSEGTAVSLSPHAYDYDFEGALNYAAWIDEGNVGSPYSFAAIPDENGAPTGRFIVGYTTGAVEEYELVAPLPGRPPIMACRRKFIGHSATVTGISISPDRRRMATCAWDGTIRLWSLGPTPPNGDVDYLPFGSRVLRVPPTSESNRAQLQEDDVMLTFDGRPFYERTRLMAQGVYKPGDVVTITFEAGLGDKEDKTTIERKIVLTDAPSYVEPYISVFLSNSEEWVAYTPNGYYDSSPQGEEYIGWHINRQRHEPALFYGVDQFRKQLYRPDVIDAALEAYNEARAVDLANAEVVGVVAKYPDVKAAPSIEIQAPKSPHRTGSDDVEITMHTTSSPAEPISRIEVRVNDRLVAGPAELINNTIDGDVVHSTYRQNVPVGPGRNQISACAISAAATSLLGKLTVENTRDEDGEKPTLRILAIGISKYADPSLQLSYADKDAQDFAEAWKRQEGAMYNRVETRVLVNEQAKVDAIRRGMSWLSQSASSPFDVAFIFLAGHGIFSPSGLWHFGGQELDLNELKATAISQSELSDLLDVEMGNRTVLFADTCHAGAFRETANARRRHPLGIEVWRSLRGMSLVSCLGTQDSVESSDWKNGAFTEAILAAMAARSVDTDNNGLLSFDELELSVKRETKRLAAEGAGVEQTPAAELPLNVSEVMLARILVE